MVDHQQVAEAAQPVGKYHRAICHCLDLGTFCGSDEQPLPKRAPFRPRRAETADDGALDRQSQASAQSGEDTANFARVIREGLLPMAQGKLASAGVMLDAMLRSAPVPLVNADQGSTESPADSGNVRELLREAKALQEKLSFVLNSGLAARFF